MQGVDRVLTAIGTIAGFIVSAFSFGGLLNVGDTTAAVAISLGVLYGVMVLLIGGAAAVLRFYDRRRAGFAMVPQFGS
jgi:hypothetical protein